ncbi:MAG: hypothetical protein Q4D77_01015 [Peptostreptococcaceae bacterium]|nr:hypothetical protein [Peptostreptococcaceae bacterium]
MEEKITAIKKYPKKFKDLCTMVRDGKGSEALAMLEAYDGLENQKKAVFAEIAYFEGDWKKALELDKEIFPFFGEWHFGNVKSEHIMAMCHAGLMLGEEKELLGWFENEGSGSLNEKQLENIRHYLTTGKHPFAKTYQPPEKPMSSDQIKDKVEKELKAKKQKVDPNGTKLFNQFFTLASAEDALDFYLEIADNGLATMWHLMALQLCDYLGDREQGLKIVLRMAKQRLWFVAAVTQVRPMEFFIEDIVLPYLEQKEDLQAIVKASEQGE